MNLILLIPQFLTGTLKIFDIIYVNNLIFIILFLYVTSFNMNKINKNYLFYSIILFSYFIVFNLNFDGLRSLIHLIIFLVGPFVTFLYINNEKKLNKFIQYINLGCFIIGIVSLTQIFIWVNDNGFNYLVNGDFFRISGLSTSPADLVAQLTVGLALSCAIKGKLLRIVAYIFYIVLLLFTMSRSALVILGIFALSEIFYGKPKLLTKLIFLITILTFIYISPIWPLIEARIFDIGNSDLNINRFLVYGDVFEKSTNNLSNLLFGHGFGAYTFYHPIANEIYDNPHNIFLYILYSSGLFGLVLFLLYIAYLLKLNFNALTICHDLEMRSLLRMILVLQLATWAVGMVETNILGIGAGWILGLIFGVPIAINIHILKGARK